jgi:CRISPR-associated protein Csb1
MSLTKEQIAGWATASAGPVALHLQQQLTSVECGEGTDEKCVIYPPTYADIGYNIDVLSDGTKVALIDSVGSQANRLEPLLISESADRKDWLVPQVTIQLKNGDRIPLLELAHRGADAVVQSSGELAVTIRKAFGALREKGDAMPLAVIAPTSLLFGVWDSRGGSGEKRPRLVRSIIRAWDVDVLHSAAQFNSVWKSLSEEEQSALESEAKKQKKKLSEKGFADAPATWRDTKAPQFRDGAPNPEARVLGGVLVNGRIVRDVTVNLVALRGVTGGSPEETAALRKYLLGLALLTATADSATFLREGCFLRALEGQWRSVPRRGNPQAVDLDSEASLALIRAFAEEAAAPFRAKWPANLEFKFDLNEAKKLLAKKDEEEPKEA